MTAATDFKPTIAPLDANKLYHLDAGEFRSIIEKQNAILAKLEQQNNILSGNERTAKVKGIWIGVLATTCVAAVMAATVYFGPIAVQSQASQRATAAALAQQKTDDDTKAAAQVQVVQDQLDTAKNRMSDIIAKSARKTKQLNVKTQAVREETLKNLANTPDSLGDPIDKSQYAIWENLPLFKQGPLKGLKVLYGFMDKSTSVDAHNKPTGPTVYTSYLKLCDASRTDDRVIVLATEHTAGTATTPRVYSAIRVVINRKTYALDMGNPKTYGMSIDNKTPVIYATPMAGGIDSNKITHQRSVFSIDTAKDVKVNGPFEIVHPIVIPAAKPATAAPATPAAPATRASLFRRQAVNAQQQLVASLTHVKTQASSLSATAVQKFQATKRHAVALSAIALASLQAPQAKMAADLPQPVVFPSLNFNA